MTTDGARGSGQRKPRSAWHIGTGDAETVLAEAQKALYVMVAFIAIIWIVQVANWADHYQLSVEYGIRPHDVGSLPDLFSAPFLHFSWAHIEGNSGPLFIFGFLAAYRGVRKFLGVTLLVAITSGLGDRHPVDLVVGLVMALSFAYQFTVLLPQHGIGWQDHIGGLVGGVVAGWLFRDRRQRKQAARPALSGGAASGGATSGGAVAGDSSRAALHKELDDLGL